MLPNGTVPFLRFGITVYIVRTWQKFKQNLQSSFVEVLFLFLRVLRVGKLFRSQVNLSETDKSWQVIVSSLVSQLVDIVSEVLEPLERWFLAATFKKQRILFYYKKRLQSAYHR